ncbi:hypothetical protein WN944_006150 [Citrus x changshan-huyou]|uniref:Uncharacterized protein n=1 Tax=Citrus x changshan-huyou TaxID=2935761 RepID=A0AAP0MLB2_9ROSI
MTQPLAGDAAVASGAHATQQHALDSRTPARRSSNEPSANATLISSNHHQLYLKIIVKNACESSNLPPNPIVEIKNAQEETWSDKKENRGLSQILDQFMGLHILGYYDNVYLLRCKNVKVDEAKQIGDLFGFSTTNDLGTYLGMPLLHSKVSKHTYQSIIDKVERRLSGWNATHYLYQVESLLPSQCCRLFLFM